LKKDTQFYKFALYGFLKNLRFFDPFIILIFREGGLSFLQIGLLYSIRDLATNILEIPTGVYADAFGRRRSMVLAFLAYICSFAIFYLCRSFWLYAFAMVLFACGEAFRSGTHKALILEYLKLNQMLDYKVAYYGRTRAASQLGSAVNSLIAAALVFYTGSYRYIFIASMVPYVLDLFNLMSYPRELDGELVQLQKGSISAQTKATLKAFSAIFSERRTMRSILNSASFTAFFKTTKDYLQPVLQAFAISLPILVMLDDTRRAAVIVGLVYFVIYLLTSYASRSSDRFSLRFANLASAVNLTFFAGAGFLVVAGVATWLDWAIVSILVFLGLYLVQNLRRPMNVAFISDQISHRVMASGLSVESQVTTILVAVLSPILGALADGFGVGTALATLGVGMLLLTPRVNVKDRSEAPE
jgi:MFS family permease